MKKVVEKFDSIASFLKAIEFRQPREMFAGGRSQASLDSSHSASRWTKTSSLTEAVDLIRSGWKEALPSFKAHADKRPAVAPKRVIKTGVAGFIPHVPNAIIGLPNSMIYSKRIAQKAKTIEIIYNNSVTSDVTADTMVRAGAAVLACVKQLEADGYRVKLTASFKGSCSSNNEYHIVSVALKNYGEGLDVQKLCFPLAHPSAMRRLGFRWFETCDRLTGRDYGCSILEVNTYREVYGCNKSAKIILAMNLAYLDSDEEMQEYIMQQIKEQ